MAWKHFWVFAAGCALAGFAQPAFANTANAPNAYLFFGSDIFENGQSENIGPAANAVLEEGMYWFEGSCPAIDGSTADCDLLRFGDAFYAKQCREVSPAETNEHLLPEEDGGGVVQQDLKSLQNNNIKPYCEEQADYRPLDEALLDHQSKVFEGTRTTADSPWVRPNLNLLFLADLPQTADQFDLQAHDHDARARGAIASTCQLLYGGEPSTGGVYPAMPTWVIMAREHPSEAALYGGVLAAAGGTGQCCYDASYNPGDAQSEPCDPTDPVQQIDICSELSQFSELAIRQGVRDGHFQCAPGEAAVQTGVMDFGSETKGTLPHILCHLAGENGHSNCSEDDKKHRRPTDVLGKMSCIRQLPYDYDGELIQLCDRYDNCRTLDICEYDQPDCSGVLFIDPGKTMFTLVGEANDQSLCGQLADGGRVRTVCPNEGDRCAAASGQGRCGQGRIVCENAREVCLPFEPMPEICNGLDDDCDSQIDNLTTSWDDFPQYDGSDLGSYDSDGVDRTGIHCHERDVCSCPSGLTLDYDGPGYETHIMSWQPGTCQCGEGLAAPGGDRSTPLPNRQPQSGCSSTNGPTGAGALGAWMLFVLLAAFRVCRSKTNTLTARRL